MMSPQKRYPSGHRTESRHPRNHLRKNDQKLLHLYSYLETRWVFNTVFPPLTMLKPEQRAPP